MTRRSIREEGVGSSSHFETILEGQLFGTHGVALNEWIYGCLDLMADRQFGDVAGWSQLGRRVTAGGRMLTCRGHCSSI